MTVNASRAPRPAPARAAAPASRRDPRRHRRERRARLLAALGAGGVHGSAAGRHRGRQPRARRDGRARGHRLPPRPPDHLLLPVRAHDGVRILDALRPSLPAATTRIKVGQITGGLQPGYHYRIVAYNGDSNGLARVGKDRVFGSKSSKLKFQLPKTMQPIPYGTPSCSAVRSPASAAAGIAIVAAGDPLPLPDRIHDGQRPGDHERQRAPSASTCPRCRRAPSSGSSRPGRGRSSAASIKQQVTPRRSSLHVRHSSPGRARTPVRDDHARRSPAPTC